MSGHIRALLAKDPSKSKALWEKQYAEEAAQPEERAVL